MFMRLNKIAIFHNFMDNIGFVALGIFIILIFSFNLIYGKGSGQISGDGLFYYVHLRSLVIDKDLHYENEFRDFNFPEEDYSLRTKTNHVPNVHSIGPALLWLPFFCLAHLCTYLANLLGFNLPLDGYSIFYQFFIGLGSIIYGFLGLFFIYQIAKRFFNKTASAISIIVIALATNVVYYFVNEPSMSHIVSMFSVSLFVYICIKDYGAKETLSYFYLGLISGLMLMIRPQNGLFIILPLFELIQVTFDNKFTRKNILSAIMKGCFYLATIFIALIPQFIVLKILYGYFFYFPDPSRKVYFFAPKLVATLFSSRNGLISWTPIILLSLIGLYYFIKKHRKAGFLFLACFIVQW